MPVSTSTSTMRSGCRRTSRPRRRRRWPRPRDGVDVGAELPDAACRGDLADRDRAGRDAATQTWPSVIRRSSRWPPSDARRNRDLALSCRAPCSAAPPAMVADRLPPVSPNGTTSLSPTTTRTCSNGTPNSSAAIWARVVWWPWPCGIWPVKRRCRLPRAGGAWTPCPAGVGALRGPGAASMKVATPMPR